MAEISPTRFLYDAMLAVGGAVKAPQGKTVAYEPIEPGPLKGDCWLCGRRNVMGYPRDKIIKPTFTDADLAKAPWSDVVCDACAWALSRRELRNYSIIATENTLLHPSKAELRDALLKPPEPPFLITVAESGQKWLHFKASISYTQKIFTVQFDDLQVRVEPQPFASILEAVERMLAVFSKAEIASGDYQVHRIQEFGMELFESSEEVLRPIRASAVFRLALHVAAIPKREKRKKEAGRRKRPCTTDSTQRQKTLV
jgi:CRISPR type IV-associated protein Csf1